MTRDYDIFDKIAWYTILALAFFVPLAYGQANLFGTTHVFTDGIMDFTKSIVVVSGTLIAITAWGLGALWRGTQIRYSPVQALLFAFLCWAALCAVIAPHTISAFTGTDPMYQGVLMLVCYALLLHLTMQYVESMKEIRLIVQAFAFSAAVVSLYGLFQWFGFDLFEWDSLTFARDRSFSLYGNPDLLGGFLSLAFFVALGLAITETEIKRKIANWVLLSLISACLVSAFTRGAWLGVIVGLVVFIGLFLGMKGKLRRSSIYGLLGATCASIFVALRSLASLGQDTNALSRVTNIAQDSSVIGRFSIWKSAWGAIKAAPFFGYGPDTYKYSVALFKTEEMQLLNPQIVEPNAHNFYLQTMLDAGIPGALLLTAFFLYAAVESARGFLLPQAPLNRSRTLFLSLWCACISYCVYLISGLSIPGTTYFFFMLIGILLVPSARVSVFKPLRVGIVPLAVVVFLAALGILQALRADIVFVQTHTAPNPEAKLIAARKAVQLNPIFTKYRLGLGLLYLDQGGFFADEYLADLSASNSQIKYASIDSLNASLEQFHEMAQRTPGYYAPYVYMAMTYNRLAEVTNDSAWIAKAVEAAQHAVALQAYDSKGNTEIARSKLMLGEYSIALEYANRAVLADPTNEIARQIIDAIDKKNSTGE